MLPAEIGPECWREIQFSIGNLPEQKITDPVFTAGSDHQFGIRKAGGIQIFLKNYVVQIIGIDVPFSISAAIFFTALTISQREP